MDFKKIKDLLKGSPDYQPTMGDVKQADRATGLGVKPQLVRGYGEDQDTMDSLRDLARIQANRGIPVSEPNDEDLQKQKMIEEMALGSIGAIKKIEPAANFVRGLTKIGSIEAPVKSTAEAMRLRQALAKQGKVAEDATIGMGNLKGSIAKQNDNTVSFGQNEIDEMIQQFPVLRNVFYPKK